MFPQTGAGEPYLCGAVSITQLSDWPCIEGRRVKGEDDEEFHRGGPRRDAEEETGRPLAHVRPWALTLLSSQNSTPTPSGVMQLEGRTPSPPVPSPLRSFAALCGKFIRSLILSAPTPLATTLQSRIP